MVMPCEEKSPCWHKERWRVGQDPFFLTLLKTRPSKTNKVCSHLRDALLNLAKGDHPEKHSLILAAMGGFDIAVLYRWQSPEKMLANYGTWEGILGGTDIVCFPWSPGEKPGTVRTPFVEFDPKLLGHGCYILSLVKLDPFEVSKKGLRFEHEFLDEVACTPADQTEIKVSVLGMVGWAECLLLVTGKSICGLLEHFIKLQALPNRETKHFFIHKSYSFLCMPGELFSDNPDVSRKAIAESFPDDDIILPEGKECPGSLVPHLHLTTTAEGARYLAQQIRSLWPSNFDSIEYVLGQPDLLCRPKAKQKWRDFVSAVIDIRTKKEFLPYLLSTSIMVERISDDGPPAEVSSNGFALRFKPLTLSQDDVTQLSELSKPIGEAVTKSIYTFNSLMQNDIYASAYTDMYAFVRHLHKVALRQPDNRLMAIEQQRWIDRHVAQLKFGLEQRAAGTFIELDHHAVGVVSPRGGHNRLMLSLEGLVHWILKTHFNCEWGGFVTVGSGGSYFHTEVGVMDVPMDRLLELSKLWPIFHEAVHCAIEIKPFLDYASNEFIDLLRQAQDQNDGSNYKQNQKEANVKNKEYEEWRLRRLLTEIAADIFVVQICLDWNVKRYFQLGQEFVERSLTGRDQKVTEQLLVRLACIYLLDKMLHFGKDVILPPVPDAPYKAVKKLLATYWDWAQEVFGGSLEITQEMRDRVDTVTPRLFPLVLWVYNRFEGVITKKPQSAAIKFAAQEGVATEIDIEKAGIDSLLVAAMWRKSPSDFRNFASDMSALLLWWDYAVTNTVDGRFQ